MISANKWGNPTERQGSVIPKTRLRQIVKEYMGVRYGQFIKRDEPAIIKAEREVKGILVRTCFSTASKIDTLSYWHELRPAGGICFTGSYQFCRGLE